MYNTVALYIMIGAAISMLRLRVLRAVAVAILMAVYLYQLALVLPWQTRADWRGAAAHIEEHARPGDLVLDLQNLGPGNWINYYLDDTPYAAKRVGTLYGACERAATSYRPAPGQEDWTASDHTVWFVVCQVLTRASEKEDYFDTVKRGFAERGLASDYQVFPGQFGVVVHRVRPVPGKQPRPSRSPVPGFFDVDYTALLGGLDLPLANAHERERALHALRCTVPIVPYPCNIHVFGHSLDLMAYGHPLLAEAMARQSLKRDPDFGLGFLAQGLALTLDGQPAAARDAFKRLDVEYPWLGDFVQPFVHALLYDEDPDAAAQAVYGMQQNGFVVFAEEMHLVCDAMRRDVSASQLFWGRRIE